MAALNDPELFALQRVTAGRFSIERELGRGGMGIVVLARDVSLERLVAIKLLPATLTANPDTRARFVREARTAARLSHPNIVPIHSVEEHGDVVFFTMGFVDGETLSARVRRAGPLSSSDGAKVIQEMAWALAYSHSAGIVHRDVKPDNVLIERATGRSMLTDFGIARVNDGSSLTGQGEMIGTAQFVSPEQAAGTEVDGRSDIYSLGVTAFFALSGRLPFEAPTLMGLLSAHMMQAPPPLASVRAGVSAKLASAVDRCLTKDPATRFQSGEELADEIADARVTVVEVPPPVRAFLRDRTRTATELLSYWGVVLYLSAFSGLSAGKLFPPIITLAIISVVGMLRSANRLRRAGFDFPDVKDAIGADAARKREEKDTAPAPVGAVGTGALLRIRLASAVIALVGFAIVRNSTASFFWVGIRMSANSDVGSVVIGLMMLIGGVSIFGLSLRRDASAQLRGIWQVSMLERLGAVIVKWIIRVAGVGVKVVPRAIAPEFKPTEVLLAKEAADMLDALPTAFQAHIGNAHQVLDRLQAHVGRLRAREEELAATLAQAGPAAAARHGGGGPAGALVASRASLATEIEQARTRAAAQRESAVAALENIRIQLLRLKTGLATPADFTADLEEAIRVEREISAVTDARAELS